MFRENTPRENTKIQSAISPTVKRRDVESPKILSPCVKSGKILKDSRWIYASISCMKSTGITDRAPARIPTPNLRAPSGELSRYENIYPQIRMGRKVMIVRGMIDKNSIV